MEARHRDSGRDSGQVAAVGRRGIELAIAILAPSGSRGCYTDGLVERRGEDIEVGIERLGAAVTLDADADLDRAIDTAVRDLAGSSPKDDIAIVMVRVTWSVPYAPR